MLKGYLHAFQKALKRATRGNKEAHDKIVRGFLDNDRISDLTSLQLICTNDALRSMDYSLEAIEEIGEIFDKIQEEVLNHLTQENTSLKKQVAELSQREQIYRSTLKEAQTTTSYSVPSEHEQSLYTSYHDERAILISNLHYLREREAMYGLLDTPLHIRNNIEAHEKRINDIDTYVAYYEAHFKASKPETDWI